LPKKYSTNLETRRFSLIHYLELSQKEHPANWEGLPETVWNGIVEAQYQAKTELFIAHEQQIEKYKAILI